MSILGRVAKASINVLTAPLRVAVVPFTYATKMLGSGLKAMGQLATGHPLNAVGTLAKGTAMNTIEAGVSLVSKGNPAIVFADGFVRNSVRLS